MDFLESNDLNLFLTQKRKVSKVMTRSSKVMTFMWENLD